MATEPLLMRPLEAARSLNMHRDTIYRLCKTGRLRHGKLQGGIYILRTDLEKFAKDLVKRTMDDRKMVEQINEGGLKGVWKK